jgi:hypothetical protein
MPALHGVFRKDKGGAERLKTLICKGAGALGYMPGQDKDHQSLAGMKTNTAVHRTTQVASPQ